MRLKQPILTNVTIKHARGLSGNVREAVGAFLPKSNLVLEVLELFEAIQAVDLKPGEETEILVTLDRSQLPPNADVKSVAAILYVMKPNPATLKGMEQAVVGIQDLGSSSSPTSNAPERLYALKMDAPGGPRNVELRLGDGPSFWSHTGTLDEGPHPLPDFSEQLNNLLDNLQSEANSVPLRFLLKSDTPGKVRIQIDRIEYSLLHMQSWINPLDDTFRVDRNLQLNFGSRERLPLQPSPDLPHSYSLAKLTMDIGGGLGPERLLGSVPDHGGQEFATTSSEFFLAQSFVTDAPIRLTGLTGFFNIDTEAELYAEIQPDADGVPASGTALTRASLVVPASDSGSRAWSYITLDPMVSLEPGQRYWMILKGIRGEVCLGLKAREEEPYGEILMNRGGQRWKRLGWAHRQVTRFTLESDAQAWSGEGPAPDELRQRFQANGVVLSSSSRLQQSRGGWQVIDPEVQRAYRIQPLQDSLEVSEETLVGQLRLVYLPEIDNQTAALEIRLEGLTAFQKIDPLPEARNFTISVSSWQGQALVLEICSHARGTLSVANVVQEYTPKGAADR